MSLSVGVPHLLSFQKNQWCHSIIFTRLILGFFASRNAIPPLSTHPHSAKISLGSLADSPKNFD